MNQAVEEERCKCRKFSLEEFLIGLALIIGAAEFSQKGVDLFGNKELLDDDDDDLWHLPDLSSICLLVGLRTFEDFFLPYLPIHE
jgi:hypothetical protein